jgi:hypothetical protein
MLVERIITGRMLAIAAIHLIAIGGFVGAQGGEQ